MHQLNAIYNSPFSDEHSHPIHTCLSVIASNGKLTDYYIAVRGPPFVTRYYIDLCVFLCGDGGDVWLNEHEMAVVDPGGGAKGAMAPPAL